MRLSQADHHVPNDSELGWSRRYLSLASKKNQVFHISSDERKTQSFLIDQFLSSVLLRVRILKAFATKAISRKKKRGKGFNNKMEMGKRNEKPDLSLPVGIYSSLSRPPEYSR